MLTDLTSLEIAEEEEKEEKLLHQMAPWANTRERYETHQIAPALVDQHLINLLAPSTDDFESLHDPEEAEESRYDPANPLYVHKEKRKR